MNPKRSWLLIVRTLLLVAALFLQPIQWVAAQSVPPTANPSAATLTQKAAVYQTLLAKAQRIGSVRVIVGVAMPLPFDPEGDLTSPQAIARQRAAIAGSQQDLLTSLAGETIQTYTRYKTIPFLAMKVDAAALVALNSSGQVVSIEEDSLDRATLASSTTVIGAPGLWTAGYQGAGQTVVILDTGIDASHPFLSGRVVGEACFSNAGGEGGAQTLCPNGQPSQTGNGAANAKTAACLVNGQQMCDHGTHVAGIVAGKGSTFSGVAPDANLIAIQVFTRVDDADFCAPDDSCVVSAR